MNQPLEEMYFNWLCAKVIRIENPTPSLTYWNLLRQLHNTEFVWLLSGDDNRAEDGVGLRLDFFREAFIKVDPEWMEIGCSVLEMMIAFSRRATFETDRPPNEWFWEFINNLGLSDFTDAYGDAQEIIDETLFNFVWRTYEFNGLGGMFPIEKPEHDQRKVEIWYQFCEYLIEQGQRL